MSSNTEFKKSKRKSELKCAAHFALISTFYIGKLNSWFKSNSQVKITIRIRLKLEICNPLATLQIFLLKQNNVKK